MTSEELAQLLSKVSLGDRQAFRSLYAETGAHLYTAALRILGNKELAEDAVQEAWIQVWNKASEFHPDRGSPLAWMVSLSRYRALDLLRRRSRERTSAYPESLEERADAHNAAEVPSAEMLLEWTGGDELKICLDELDGQQSQAILMAYVAGQSHSEIADAMSEPLGTVKSWIRRGILQLRRCLGINPDKTQEPGDHMKQGGVK